MVSRSQTMARARAHTHTHTHPIGLLGKNDQSSQRPLPAQDATNSSDEPPYPQRDFGI